MKKYTKTQTKKSAVFTPQNDLPTLKIPVEIDDVDNNTLPTSLLTQRTIEVASAAVIINNIITIPHHFTNQAKKREKYHCNR